mmetsp:Transcript_93982/g.181315  ORF Transcript_93982/g.181315 Transcript_93982/m.181315 type:complete len:99 (+) Transcript_93982:58-354(+)
MATAFMLGKPTTDVVVGDAPEERVDVSTNASDEPHGLSSDLDNDSDAPLVGLRPLASRLAKAMERCRTRDEEADGELIFVAEWCSVGARLSQTFGSMP